MTDTKKILKCFLHTDKIRLIVFLLLYALCFLINLFTDTVTANQAILPLFILTMGLLGIITPISAVCSTIPKLIIFNVPRKKIVKGYFIYTFLMMFINASIFSSIIIFFNKLSLPNINKNNLLLFIIVSFLIMSLVSVVTGWISVVFLSMGGWYGVSNMLIILGLIILSSWKIYCFTIGYKSLISYTTLLSSIIIVSYLSYKFIKKIEITS